MQAKLLMLNMPGVESSTLRRQPVQHSRVEQGQHQLSFFFSVLPQKVTTPRLNVCAVVRSLLPCC